MKKTFYSPRLEKEFELTVCEPIPGQIVGDGSDISIVRASALENLLFHELAGAVEWNWKELANGAIIVDIKDDTGVHVAGVGDINQRSLKNDVAKAFPVATAWSRAISAAVIKYLGFEGRVYTDASFEIEKSDTAEEKVETEKTSAPVAVSEPATEQTTEPSAELKPDTSLKVTFGKYKGQTIQEILDGDGGLDYFKFCQEKGWLDRHPEVQDVVMELLKQ